LNGRDKILSMGIQENKPSSTPLPRREIPDGWAISGHCPACGATNLKVTHLPDLADYLSCTKCEIAFEVECGGKYVRLKYIPDALEFMDAILHNRWVEASRLSSLINEKRAPAQEKKNTPPPPSILSEEDAWDSALSMYRLGNKPKMIQLILVQSGQTQELANAILARLKKVAEQDAQRQNRKFWTLAGISFLVIFFMAGSWLYISGKLPVLLGLVTVTPVPTRAANQPSAIGSLLNLIPKDAKPDLMNLPDTKVEENKGPARAECPVTPALAAQLFGGDPSTWKRDDSQFPSWQMISTSDSVTVSVPDGMTAGYVDNKTLNWLSVHGPATIYNTNFIVITCD
jgi:hypothetical protein